MIKVEGVHNTAVCYTDDLDAGAAEQIKTVCDRAEFADCKIRIMPDVHLGKGCTIGTTMTITDKVVPGMVGVDIGCGMETVKLAEREIDFKSLDKVIHKLIPSGRDVHRKDHPRAGEINLEDLRCKDSVNLARARRSIGTLGGGNHFIEVDKTDGGDLYLIVHSGSRHLGTEVADYYQDEAWKSLCGNSKMMIDETIAKLKEEGRHKEIADTIRKMKEQTDVTGDAIPQELAYVSGALFDDYIHDMKIIQRFATLNRIAMVEIIMTKMGLGEVERFTTIHNYIDTDSMILRKGAVRALAGEKLLVPINMRDGSLICVGNGNDDWNCSAPHGAGRLLSRSAAFKKLTLEEYEKEMEGVYTTSVHRGTLDESPMAYKKIDEIIKHIGDTAEIVERMRPVYNFKASD